MPAEREKRPRPRPLLLEMISLATNRFNGVLSAGIQTFRYIYGSSIFVLFVELPQLRCDALASNSPIFLFPLFNSLLLLAALRT
jgi:hypothetical protein